MLDMMDNGDISPCAVGSVLCLVSVDVEPLCRHSVAKDTALM